MSATNNLPTLSLEAAKIASEAAQEKAREMGIGTLLLACLFIKENSPTPTQKLPLKKWRGKNNEATTQVYQKLKPKKSLSIPIIPQKSKTNKTPPPNHTDFNIALVDTTLTLLHFTRMPHAKLTSIAIAQDKAFTAAGHRAPTSMYTTGATAKNFLPGGPGFGIFNSNGGRFCVIGGGLPIEVGGRVVGGIGVSTGTPAQDEEVARAGVEAVGRWVGRREGAKL